ncbi:hypothetical protein GOODEAATRI_013550 [Goodea atripinnis]|uniref:Kruppel-like factor 15 n=1 Tax=Goodea atripinnis TaxID=208336 RepID=A0ABV0N131_9TELE
MLTTKSSIQPGHLGLFPGQFLFHSRCCRFSPYPRSCSSPDSQELSSSCGSNSSAEGQDSILDHLLSQTSLGSANSASARSAASVSLSTFQWDLRRDEPSKHQPVKEEDFDFITWSNVEAEEQLGGSFQPTLEEIEEFLEENMEMVAIKHERVEVEPEETSGLDGGLDCCRASTSEPKLEPETKYSDHTVPTASTFSPAIAASAVNKTALVNPTHESGAGARKTSTNKPSLLERDTNCNGMPVILQIQPIHVKQEPTITRVTPAALPSQPASASDIKIAQLLVNIQGQTFALVPHILPSPSFSVSKFVRIAPVFLYQVGSSSTLTHSSNLLHHLFDTSFYSFLICLPQTPSSAAPPTLFHEVPANASALDSKDLANTTNSPVSNSSSCHHRTSTPAQEVHFNVI